MFIIIVFWLGRDSPPSFFRNLFTSFLTLLLSSLLTFFVCFCILFNSCCSHARVFGKTLVHQFLISYSHTECFFLLLFLCSFLNSCGCSTAKSMTPPQEIFFFTHFNGTEHGSHQSLTTSDRDWFLFQKLESSLGIWTRDLRLRSP